MIEIIKETFPKCITNGCLSETSNNPIEIFEHETNSRCYLQAANTKPVHFTVNNPQEKPLNFLAIDNCLFNETDIERCDCALFDKKTILFIELKVGGGRRNRKNLVRKAKSQLKSTISYFSEKVDLSKIEKRAIINVGYSQERPSFQTSIQQARLVFQEELDTYFDIAEKVDF